MASERKPFDPDNAYDQAVELYRLAALDGMAAVKMPEGVSSKDAIVALPHGAAMAFVCIVMATAVPGQHRRLLKEMTKQLPAMMKMAETIEPREVLQ